MSNYTPGPWKLDLPGWWETRTGGIHGAAHNSGGQPRIADITVRHDSAADLPMRECRANLRLIALAPEMYAMLQRIVDDVVPGQGTNCRIAEIEALLAKANGQEQGVTE